MNDQRKLELEDGDEYQFPTDVADLVEQVRQNTAAMDRQYSEAITQPVIIDNCENIRLLIVDDNKIFLDMLNEEAEKLNTKHGQKLTIKTLIPDSPIDVRNCILKSIETPEQFDYVLLDMNFAGKNFNGFSVLSELRQQYNNPSLTELDSRHLTRLNYLPVAIVTHSQPHQNFEDEALGQGADKIYSDKGFNSAPKNQEEPMLSPEPLLKALINGGFKEMRFRAWSRMWLDVNDQLEYEITKKLENNDWIEDETIESALKAIWASFAKPIKGSGYAAHLSMRWLKKEHNGWKLLKIGSTDASCLESIAWNQVPLFANLLEEKSRVEKYDKLEESQIVCNPQDAACSAFAEYVGRSAIAACLHTRSSPVGTFFITRAPGFQFYEEEKTQVRILADRIGLFCREVRMRQRYQRRLGALLDLGSELMEKEDENEIVAKSVKVLHLLLHLSRHRFMAKAANSNEELGRISIRLIEPGTGRLMRPDQRYWDGEDIPLWALGYGTDNEPSKFTIYEDIRYQELVETGEPQFFFDPKPENLDNKRRLQTKAKILVPIKVGPVVIGAINAEHQHLGFYGKDKSKSTDLTLLQNVALEVGQALLALRARRMLRNLLTLHYTMANADEESVMEKITAILYGYTGCAVGIWAKPDAFGHWNIIQVWECKQGYAPNEQLPTHFKNDHKVRTQRLNQWQEHVMTDKAHFNESLIGQVIQGNLQNNEQEPVIYRDREESFLKDESIGVTTRSQAVLALRDTDSNERLGILALLFNQKPGLDIDRQQPLLIEAAYFCSGYLSLQRENRRYWDNSQIIQQQSVLGLAFQQMRHSLKLQLGNLNGIIDRLQYQARNGDLSSTILEDNVAQIKKNIRIISEDIDISKVLMRAPVITRINLSVIWQETAKRFQMVSEKIDAVIIPMSSNAWIYCDADIVKLAFGHLIDNALEAMENSEIRQIECLLLPSEDTSHCLVAVHDSGPGINPAITERLFKDIGVSTKPKGSGFGSYISAIMLARCGSSIEYDRHWQDGGARFILSFPTVAEEAKLI
jgi:signal transduction histidine kinase/CheY-like chemotaxis protein